MDEEYKARSRDVWGLGDYAPASRQLEPAAVALVDALEVAPGMTLLDVAAGHGNCTLAAARRGATVLATDFSPTMIAAGSARTQAAGLDIVWQEADAAALPFDADRFDRVTSTFGAIFAAEQEQVAAELIRVLRPGGILGMTAWTPDGMTARTLALRREFGLTMPAGAPDPFRWGNPDEVAAIFAPLGCDVRVERRTLTFRYPSWEQWKADSDAHGMAVVARQNMDPDVYAAMRSRMQEVTAEFDYGEGDAVAFDSDYVEIIVRKAA